MVVGAAAAVSVCRVVAVMLEVVVKVAAMVVVEMVMKVAA